MQNGDNKTRLIDCGQVRCLLAHLMVQAMAVATMSDHKLAIRQEQELFRDRVYEDAVSGTDAAGSALERIHGVYQNHWDLFQRVELYDSIVDGIDEDGMSAALSPEEANFLSSALEPVAEQLLDRLRVLTDEVDGTGIYDLMPEPLNGCGLDAIERITDRAMDLVEERYGAEDKAVRYVREVRKELPYER